MAKKRLHLRDLTLIPPKNPERRLRALEDPILFCTTYFPKTFNQPFTEDREAMIYGICDAADYGGDSAIAGPRGEGKTRIAMYGGLYLMCSMRSTFPMVIGKSQTKAQNELFTIRERLQQEPLFLADFPEIGIPFKAVGPWPTRARMQTIGGEFTRIVVAVDHLIFPTITDEMLPDNWPKDVPHIGRGQIFASMGIDGPIRGTNYRDERPTLAIIDDIEDRESAFSDPSIARNEDLIEKDIGGLGENIRRVSRIMLCTTQNRKCIAYKYTDREQKRSWRGVRYRKMKTPPEREDLWEQYVELRQTRSDDDPDAREAWRFYRDNRQQMNAGCMMSNPLAFDDGLHRDGQPIELSAVQSYYNNVADRGKLAVQTEDDNDPPEETGPVGIGLSKDVVMSRLNGLQRRQLPSGVASLTIGIDLGKYALHWVAIAWLKNATGFVVDYGVQEVYGQEAYKDPSQDIIRAEPQVYKALLQLREQLLKTEFVDASGERKTIDAVAIDSGTYTNAAYQFVREVGRGWYPVKGLGKYRPRTESTKTIKAGDHMHASYQQAHQIWLWDIGVDYWKNWVHERFLTPTFDSENRFTAGALSLFELTGRQRHLSYASHITAEELVTQFHEGSGSKTFWNVISANNHWLDATTYACAIGRYTGVDLMAGVPTPTNAPKAFKPKKPTKRQPRSHNRFRARAGGWVQGLRR